MQTLILLLREEKQKSAASYWCLSFTWSCLDALGSMHSLEVKKLPLLPAACYAAAEM